MDTGLIQALLIGLLSGMGLLAGAAFAVFVPLSHSRIASVVAVGAGLLLAAASLELIDKAAMDACKRGVRTAVYAAWAVG